MATKKNNQKTLENSLNQSLIEQELLILGKDSAESSAQDPLKLFEQGANYLKQGRDTDEKQLKAKCYIFACFYFYLAQYYDVPNARSMRLEAQGEMAAGYFDSKYKDILCGKSELGLQEARDFIPAVLQSYIEFSKNCFIKDVGIAPYLVPSHILGAFQTAYESGFAFDHGVDPDDSKQELDPIEFVAQSLHRSQGLDCEEFVGEDLASFLLWSFDRTPDKAGFAKDIFGMPAECAYLVGMSYIEGKIIPRDKIQACRFIRYAMLTGSPRACLAWAVYFEGFGYRQQNNTNQDLLEDYSIDLFHGLLLCALPKNSELVEHINSLSLRGFNEHDGINIQCSLMYSLSMILAFRALRLNCAPEEPSGDAVLNLFCLMLNLYHKDPEAEEYLRCALACLFFVYREEDVYALRLGVATSFFINKVPRRNSRVTEPYLVIQALLEPLLEKKSELAQKIVCYVPMDTTEKFINKSLQDLAKKNNASALFKLATEQFYNGKMGYDTFTKLAELGHPVSQYNVSLNYQTGAVSTQDALNLAMKSLRSGIPMSFYTIYDLLKNSKDIVERQLAYTCLRYAAEFILPKTSADELNKAKGEQRYKPLPFMVVLDEIEKNAANDPTCAVFLGTLYAHGNVMPHDQYKAMTYFRQAVSFGDLISISELSTVYGATWSVPDKGYILSSMQHALDIMSRFGIGAQKNSGSNNGAIAHRLAKKLYEALKNGNTWLEKNIFDRARDDAVWSVFNIKNSAPVASKKHAALFFDSSSEELLNIYAEDQAVLYMRDEFTISSDKRALELLKIVANVHDESYEKRMTELKVLLSLRGSAGGLVNSISDDILHGANCDSYLCHALYVTDLRPLASNNLEKNDDKLTKPQAKIQNTKKKEPSVQEVDDGFLDFTSLD